jgi:NADPH2:quinone reductase
MKAIVVSESGGPEQLVLRDVPEPTHGTEDLLISVDAAGLNYIDVYQRSGLYPTPTPFTPGSEGAGEVVGLGSEVYDFSIGDKVGWAFNLGSYAELHSIPARQAIPLPSSIETTTAAAVLLQGITAHYLSVDSYPIKAGERCLIHAGAGGVGRLLTQIAKMRGAEVFTTVGSSEKAEISTAAGADHVILYDTTDFKAEVEEVIGPKALDVVYDGVGASTFLAGLDLLRPRGMMVAYGNASGPPPEISPLLLAQKGSLFLTRASMAHYVQTQDELLGRANDVFGWINDGSLDVLVSAEFALSDVADAHRVLENRETTGKVLIRT